MPRFVPRFSIPFLLLTSLVPLLLGSRWPEDPAEANALQLGTTNTIAVDVIHDGAGGCVALWTDGWLRAQRYDRNGVPQWGTSPLQIVPVLGSTWVRELVKSNEAGEWVLLYRWANNGRVYAQKLSPSGQPSWPAEGAQVSDISGVFYTDFLPTSDGGLFAVLGITGADPNLWMNRVDASGAFVWDPSGEVLCNAVGAQVSPRMVDDGAGGFFAVWMDDRSGINQVYAQRVDGNGNPAWTANGLPVAASAFTQTYPDLAPDGAGGVFVVWEERATPERHIRMQRLDALGNALWGATGVELTTTTLRNQFDTRIVPDGSGGAVTIWREFLGLDHWVTAQRVDGNGQRLWGSAGVRSSELFDTALIHLDLATDGSGFVMSWEQDDDVFAQKLDGAGNLLWDATGTAVAVGSSIQDRVAVAMDDRGGAYVIYRDDQTGIVDPHASHVMASGDQGYPSPDLAGWQDFPQDQGKVGILEWSPSLLDRWGNMGMTEYWIWRRLPGAVAKSISSLPSEMESVPEAQALVSQGWDFVGATPPMDLVSYSDAVPTYGDSTETEIVVTEWMVSTYVRPGEFYLSETLSGYSVDNLAPSVPQNLVASYQSESVGLDWDDAAEPDVRYFRIYRNVDPDFTPSPASLVAEVVTSQWTDPTPLAWAVHYRVSAVDFAGNEGDAASPVTATAVDGPPVPSRAAVYDPYPNPFNPQTIFAFDLPKPRRTSLSVYDLAGRHVVTLLEGEQPAGHHRVIWRGLDGEGRPVASGAYLFRLEAGGWVETRRAVLLK